MKTDYNQDPVKTTMSGQPVSDDMKDVEANETTTAEGVFLADTEVEHIPIDEQHIEKPGARRVTELIGDSVINTQGESLGSIEDIVVDFKTGKVIYVVLSFGGFLDFGDKLFAIPVDAFDFIPEEKVFILNMNREQLENAPGFDKVDWPNMADPQWNRQVQDYYMTRPSGDASIPEQP